MATSEKLHPHFGTCKITHLLFEFNFTKTTNHRDHLASCCLTSQRVCYVDEPELVLTHKLNNCTNKKKYSQKKHVCSPQKKELLTRNLAFLYHGPHTAAGRWKPAFCFRTLWAVLTRISTSQKKKPPPRQLGGGVPSTSPNEAKRFPPAFCADMKVGI